MTSKGWLGVGGAAEAATRTKSRTGIVTTGGGAAGVSPVKGQLITVLTKRIEIAAAFERINARG